MFRIMVYDVCGEKYLHLARMEHQMRIMYANFCAYYSQTAVIFVLNDENEIILKNT